MAEPSVYHWSHPCITMWSWRSYEISLGFGFTRQEMTSEIRWPLTFSSTSTIWGSVWMPGLDWKHKQVGKKRILIELKSQRNFDIFSGSSILYLRGYYSSYGWTYVLYGPFLVFRSGWTCVACCRFIWISIPCEWLELSIHSSGETSDQPSGLPLTLGTDSWLHQADWSSTEVIPCEGGKWSSRWTWTVFSKMWRISHSSSSLYPLLPPGFSL